MIDARTNNGIVFREHLIEALAEASERPPRELVAVVQKFHDAALDTRYLVQVHVVEYDDGARRRNEVVCTEELQPAQSTLAQAVRRAILLTDAAAFDARSSADSTWKQAVETP